MVTGDRRRGRSLERDSSEYCHGTHCINCHYRRLRKFRGFNSRAVFGNPNDVFGDCTPRHWTGGDVRDPIRDGLPRRQSLVVQKAVSDVAGTSMTASCGCCRPKNSPYSVTDRLRITGLLIWSSIYRKTGTAIFAESICQMLQIPR